MCLNIPCSWLMGHRSPKPCLGFITGQHSVNIISMAWESGPTTIGAIDQTNLALVSNQSYFVRLRLSWLNSYLMIASIFCQDLPLKVAYTHGRFRCHGYLWLCWLLRVSFREEHLAAVVPKNRSWVDIAAINVSFNLGRTGITKTSVSLTLSVTATS